ncbi:hypothetical protein TCAL_14529 [Tigriopus californicus]|uniref:AMP-dependent synthetase/ligase domain-containing protein n=1 Tax=Tigriopus californicus TaxID=6832 RepID=A0A553PRT4_TIGCA|nr:hypothetical protein TCAL_14529 [Tigriopus californicus]
MIDPRNETFLRARPLRRGESGGFSINVSSGSGGGTEWSKRKNRRFRRYSPHGVWTRLGKTESFEQLCTDSDVLEAVLKDLSTTGLSQGLEKFEIPSALTLCPDPWTPESGLITAAFKLKRKVVQRQFQDRINQMYSQKRPSSP